MGKAVTVWLAMLGLLVNACTTGQTQQETTGLDAEAFAGKIKETPRPQVVDVRTPEEFEKGHLQQALNFDWNGSLFEQQIAGLDKSKPVFVYCLSGGRSSAAADRMRSEGFREVYQLNGGMMKWRAANLPETTRAGSEPEGMNRADFDALISTHKEVLVDFYADWCAPCKRMKPYLDEISVNMKDRVTVLRINADDNRDLCRELKVDTLPLLQLYKDKQLVWSNQGYIEKSKVLEKL